MARKEIAVKKYVVILSNEEREHLTALIHSGNHPAQKLLKARILLKADASDGGEGWSDSQIAAALESSVDTVARTRQRLVEEGFEAALIRKHSPNSARQRIFDGAAEARLIALACSKPPAGRARKPKRRRPAQLSPSRPRWRGRSRPTRQRHRLCRAGPI